MSAPVKANSIRTNSRLLQERQIDRIKLNLKRLKIEMLFWNKVVLSAHLPAELHSPMNRYADLVCLPNQFDCVPSKTITIGDIEILNNVAEGINSLRLACLIRELRFATERGTEAYKREYLLHYRNPNDEVFGNEMFTHSFISGDKSLYNYENYQSYYLTADSILKVIESFENKIGETEKGRIGRKDFLSTEYQQVTKWNNFDVSSFTSKYKVPVLHDKSVVIFYDQIFSSEPTQNYWLSETRNVSNQNKDMIQRIEFIEHYSEERQCFEYKPYRINELLKLIKENWEKSLSTLKSLTEEELIEYEEVVQKEEKEQTQKEMLKERVAFEYEYELANHTQKKKRFYESFLPKKLLKIKDEKSSPYKKWQKLGEQYEFPKVVFTNNKREKVNKIFSNRMQGILKTLVQQTKDISSENVDVGSTIQTKTYSFSPEVKEIISHESDKQKVSIELERFSHSLSSPESLFIEDTNGKFTYGDVRKMNRTMRRNCHIKNAVGESGEKLKKNSYYDAYVGKNSLYENEFGNEVLVSKGPNEELPEFTPYTYSKDDFIEKISYFLNLDNGK